MYIDIGIIHTIAGIILMAKKYNYLTTWYLTTPSAPLWKHEKYYAEKHFQKINRNH